MKRCPNCMREWPDETKFCGYCGKYLGEVPLGKYKKGKKIWKLFLLAIIVAIAVVGIQQQIFQNTKSDKDAYVLLTGDELKLLKNLKSADLVDIPSDQMQEISLSGVKFSLDGKYIYFLARYDEESETGDLYKCEYGKLKKDSSKNEKYCELVDTEVMADFTFVENNKVIYRDKNSDMYIYDGKESERIEKSVNRVFYTDDLSRIVYETGSYGEKYTLYGIELKNVDNKIQLAEGYTGLYQITNFDEIFYMVSDNEGNTETYVTGFQKEPKKLGQGITNMLAVNNERMFYLTESAKTIEDVIDDMVVDSRGDTDELETIKSYLRMDYGVNKITTLNMYQNGKSTDLSESVVGAQNYGDAILYCDMGSVKKMDIAEYGTDVESIYQRVLENLLRNCFWTVSRLTGKVVHMSGDTLNIISMIQTNESSQIYITDTDMLVSCNKTIMTAPIIDNMVSDKFEDVTENGWVRTADESTAYYISDEHSMNGDSYCSIYTYKEGESSCIARDILYRTVNMYEDGDILTYTDYENNRGYELSVLHKNGEKDVIAEEVRQYIRCEDSAILYLAGSDLWSYKNGKSTKVVSNVDQIWSLKSMKIDISLGTLNEQ